LDAKKTDRVNLNIKPSDHGVDTSIFLDWRFLSAEKDIYSYPLSSHNLSHSQSPKKLHLLIHVPQKMQRTLSHNLNDFEKTYPNIKVEREENIEIIRLALIGREDALISTLEDLIQNYIPIGCYVEKDTFHPSSLPKFIQMVDVLEKEIHTIENMKDKGSDVESSVSQQGELIQRIESASITFSQFEDCLRT